MNKDTQNTSNYNILPYPEKSPYFVSYGVFSNSKISNDIAVGELVFMPKGIYFLAGYFTTIPGQSAPNIHHLPGFQLFETIMYSNTWGEFHKNLEAGLRVFRRKYHGTTPEWVCRYPETDIRFIETKKLKSARLEGGQMTIGDEEYFFSDKGESAKKVKDYLANPESSDLYREFNDPLGFFAEVPGILKVYLALTERMDLPQLQALTKASEEYADNFVKFISFNPKGEGLLSNVGVLPQEFKKKLIESVKKSERPSRARFIGAVVASSIFLVGAIVARILGHGDFMGGSLVASIVFLGLVALNKSELVTYKRVTEALGEIKGF